MDITKLRTPDELLADSVFEEVFEIQDPIERSKLILALQDKAKLLNIKSKFDEMVRAYKKVDRELRKSSAQVQQTNNSFDNYTRFDYFDDGHELYCGNWIADQNGVRTFTMFGEQLACYHPILIAQRLMNAETGKEKVKIAFQKGFKWKEIIVDKGMIASSNKIVNLADYGVSVTSETSKSLVKFLSDIENYNIQDIDTRVSTSKFGWINDEFMPYGLNVEFDSESRFKDIFESVQSHGSFDKWMELALKVRKSGRFEPQLYMAGSFASVLLKPLNVLPFILNLWGETGKGKTVALMLATSIWANPAESKYITDPVSSQVALEVRNDILNHLPMVIDDLSKTKDKYGDAFTDLIYMLCGGKGKDRSNISLGLNKATTWQNVVLTNIERPLASETMRGGAINRILDFEMEEGSIFKNGNKVVSLISENYGFAGRLFVQAVQQMGFDSIREIQQGFLEQIVQVAKGKGQEKEEKQTIPLSVMLTADKIATDIIFKDGIYLDIDRCVDALKNKGEVSENDRAYEFIMSEISININKFEPDDDGNYKGECWGCIENGYAIILVNAFNRMCERGSFSNKGFLSWAAKNKLILQDSGGKNTRNKRFGQSNPRCVWLKMESGLTDTDGFMLVDEHEHLPFD
jgi:hypothetical protein